MFLKYFRLHFSPDDNTGGAGGGGNTGGNTGAGTGGGDEAAGLRSALQAERARANQLQGQLTQIQQQMGDLDLAAARQALTDRDNLQGQLSSLQNQLHSKDIELTANNVLSQVLPEYRDLFRSTVHSQLTVNEQGQVTVADGRSLDQVTTELKQKYPTMFAADQIATGAGTTPNTGSTTPTAPTVVTPDNGIITGVDPDSVISGQVRIK